MNTSKRTRVLATIFSVLTVLTAIYTVATRANAGGAIVLMLITVVLFAFSRRQNDRSGE